MSEERIAQLVVEYLLIAAGGMVDDTQPEPASAGDGGNTGDRGRKSGGKSGSRGEIPLLTDIFKQFETKLLTLLGPVALLASALTSMTSGMSVFLGVVKLIGNTLGVALFPVIALVSAVLLALNDVVLALLIPNLEEWATTILQGGLDAINAMGNA